jgi:hypothetical protein
MGPNLEDVQLRRRAKLLQRNIKFAALRESTLMSPLVE